MKVIGKQNYAVNLSIIMFAFVLIEGMIVSCNDMLNVKPTDTITSDAVWNNVSLAEAYVNQIYASMRSGFDHDPRLSILSDEANGRGRDIEHSIVQGEMSPDNMSRINYWDHYYNLIKKCNSYLSEVSGNRRDKLESQDKAKVQRMEVEVKFLRAYFYFRLVAFHGGVPLITKPFELGDDYQVKRSSYKKVMKFVIDQLDEAAKLLPLEYSDGNAGRATKGAALAIKSRALLYMASPLVNSDEPYMETSHPELVGYSSYDRTRWKKARDAAKKVIDLNKYSLYPDYKKMFLTKNNGEFIWVQNFNNDIAQRNRVEVVFWPNGSGGYAQVNPLQNTVHAFETQNGLLPEKDPSYDPQHPYENRDPRFYDMILYNGASFKERKIQTFTPGGVDSPDGPEGWNTSTTGYYIRKFTDESIQTPPTAYTPSSPPWPYIRYAEILLNYAEASYHLGDEEVARTYLNKIRSRPSVDMPPVTAAGDKLLERIQHERRIELYLEEQRWFDVRRWKIADKSENIEAERMQVKKNTKTSEVTYKPIGFQNRKFYPRDYLVPIPKDEMNKSTKLVQNPGYQ